MEGKNKDRRSLAELEVPGRWQSDPSGEMRGSERCLVIGAATSPPCLAVALPWLDRGPVWRMWRTGIAGPFFDYCAHGGYSIGLPVANLHAFDLATLIQDIECSLILDEIPNLYHSFSISGSSIRNVVIQRNGYPYPVETEHNPETPLTLFGFEWYCRSDESKNMNKLPSSVGEQGGLAPV